MNPTDSLFVAIGRLEARARKLAHSAKDTDTATTLTDVATKLEEAWKLFTDNGVVR